jgi:hypothetical protein
MQQSLKNKMGVVVWIIRYGVREGGGGGGGGGSITNRDSSWTLVLWYDQTSHTMLNKSILYNRRDLLSKAKNQQ